MSALAEATPAADEDLLEFLYLCPMAVLQLGPRGEIEMVNPAGMRLLMPLAAAAGFENLFDLLEPYAGPLRRQHADLVAERGTVCEDQRVEVGAVAGHALPLVMALTLVKISPARSMAVLADVSRSVWMERRAAEAENQVRAMIEGIREYALLGLDPTGFIQSWNASAQRLFGFDEAEVVGQPMSTLLSEDSGSGAVVEALDRGWSELEGRWRRKDGADFRAHGLLSPTAAQADDARGVTLVIKDLSGQDRLRDLATLAETDPLTGVANRRGLAARGRVALERARAAGQPVSVVQLDADHFKRVNDTYGHPAGDAVLRALAEACAGQVRDGDVVARLGGEEFGLLLPGADRATALGVAERVRLAVEASVVTHGGDSIRYTISLGVAELEPGEPIDAALQRADAALYRAKQGGRNRVAAAAERGGG